MFQKIKEATKSAVQSMEEGMKKLSYRSEISDRRKIIRNLKSEWGCCLFDVMEKPNRDDLLQSSYEVLKKAIAEKQAEIHAFEEKYLTLHEVIGDSLTVHRKKYDKEKDLKEINCDVCRKIIPDERINCGTYNFHVNCFHCFSCEKDITSLPQIFFLDLKAYCDDCGEKHIVTQLENINTEILLEWVINEIRGFNQLEIKDFDPLTWRNGLGFACLCVKYFPNLFHWKPLIEGLMNDTPLGVCQAGIDGLKSAGVTMLFMEANELRECDTKSIIFQVMLIRKFFLDKQPNPKGQTEWNTHLEKIPPKHFLKTEFRKEHESFDKSGIIKKEAERMDQERLIEQEARVTKKVN